jgi:hypothetical protein
MDAKTLDLALLAFLSLFCALGLFCARCIRDARRSL